MHITNFKPDVLCLATVEFNNSLRELKDNLYFNINFLEKENNDILLNNYELLLIETDLLQSFSSKFIDKIHEKEKILLCNSNKFKNIKFSEKVDFPITLMDLNKSIKNIITRKKFVSNSSIKIKDYILDKNQKKLKKDKTSIIITEKEVQLLELLFNAKKPLMKKKILSIVWNYASDADTHTVETHIYRLRKKILENFDDNNFIQNTKKGYNI